MTTQSDITDKLPIKLRVFIRTTDLNVDTREAFQALYIHNCSVEELISHYKTIEQKRRETLHNGIKP